MKNVTASFIVLTLLAACSQSPQEKAMSRDRDAISFCHEDEKKVVSMGEGARNLMASACEKMESDFRDKYGVAP